MFNNINWVIGMLSILIEVPFTAKSTIFRNSLAFSELNPLPIPTGIASDADLASFINSIVGVYGPYFY